ncbi:MAG TPA: pseudouridine synthase [Planctomycetota bacterium]|nr:pseudouridine synthase [Planctomycetota bacterium]
MAADSHRKTLDRALSRAGVCSRVVAREWIAAGRVQVNGATALDAEQWVDVRRDAISVDGRRVSEAAREYFALNKPKGFLTSRGDPKERRTVYDLLDGLDAWVVPVGRLDRDTSGLLLLTNDTDWAERITSPTRHVAKTYRVQAAPRLGEDALEALRRGVELDDGPTRPAVVTKIRDAGDTSILELTITEGRNRQVRRMLHAVGAKVRELKRVAIGSLQLGTLSSGRWRALTRAEVESLGASGSQNAAASRVRRKHLR